MPCRAAAAVAAVLCVVCMKMKGTRHKQKRARRGKTRPGGPMTTTVENEEEKAKRKDGLSKHWLSFP